MSEGIPVEESGNLVAVTGSVIAPPDVSERRQLSDMVHDRVMKLRDEMASSYFEMGRLLYQMSHDGLWTYQTGGSGVSYATFKDYVEAEVDFQYRKAKHLMSTWWWFAEKIGSPKVSEKIKEIGWTKAAMLVGVVDEKNVDIWVDKAKKLTTGKLNQECKLAMEAASRKRRPDMPTPPTADDIQHRGSDPLPGITEKLGVNGDVLVSGALPSPIPASGAPEHSRMGVDPLAPGEVREVRRRWGVIVTGDQETNIDQAIDAASEIRGIANDGKGYLLDFIATHFLSFHAGSSAESDRKHQKNFRDDTLRRIQSYLGVDIVALDRETGELVFGEKAVDRIVETEDEDEGQ